MAIWLCPPVPPQTHQPRGVLSPCRCRVQVSGRTVPRGDSGVARAVLVQVCAFSPPPHFACRPEKGLEHFVKSRCCPCLCGPSLEGPSRCVHSQAGLPTPGKAAIVQGLSAWGARLACSRVGAGRCRTRPPGEGGRHAPAPLNLQECPWEAQGPRLHVERGPAAGAPGASPEAHSQEAPGQRPQERAGATQSMPVQKALMWLGVQDCLRARWCLGRGQSRA